MTVEVCHILSADDDVASIDRMLKMGLGVGFSSIPPCYLL